MVRVRAVWLAGLAASSVVAIPGAGWTQAVAPAVAARIDSVFGRYGAATPGCALMVRTNGQTAYVHSYGLASLESGVPITPRTEFNLASASKEFTAASVMLLVDTGKLSLDDDVRQYVPELPNLGGPVTIRQLLTHTSGWRDYIQLLVWQGHEVRDHLTSRDALKVLERQRALNFAPGTAFSYSNTGYFLLGSSCSACPASPSRSLRTITSSNHSACTTRGTSRIRATSFRDGRWRTSSRLTEPGAKPCQAGTSSATAAPIRRSRTSRNGTTHSSPDAWSATPYSTRSPHRSTCRQGRASRMAFVSSSTRMAAAGACGNGIWAGYRSLFMRFPDAHLTIIALCNAADAPSEQLGDAVADILVPRVSAKSSTPVWARANDADQLAGDYYSGATNQRVQVVVDSGRLALAGPPPVPLLPVGPRTLRVGTSDIEFLPAHGLAETMLAHNDGRTSPYHRVGPPLDRSAFTQYEGRYWSDELGVSYRVVLRSDTLQLRDDRGEDAPLVPLFRDGFDGPGTVRFERDSTGIVTAMTFTTRGVDALPFTRVRERADE